MQELCNKPVSLDETTVFAIVFIASKMVGYHLGLKDEFIALCPAGMTIEAIRCAELVVLQALKFDLKFDDILSIIDGFILDMQAVCKTYPHYGQLRSRILEQITSFPWHLRTFNSLVLFDMVDVQILTKYTSHGNTPTFLQ